MDVVATAVRVAALRLQVRGIVQGVGFRPFVWRLARELALSGWVRNGPDGVEILVQGAPDALAALPARLRAEAPPRARIDGIEAETLPADAARAAGFAILDSAGGRVTTAIGADTAVCADCLAEMRDAADRRHRYAFTTCTHCGPRYTIARALPYDRATTSLAPFPLCAVCAAEYADPANRRFHAEATCCPACGPRLALHDAAGALIVGNPLASDPASAPAGDPIIDPIAAVLHRLRAGEIVAIKGLGGFHLACNARDAAAVTRLRARKMRDEKPFALMVADLGVLADCVRIDAAAAALLASAERPIVLLPKLAPADAAFAGVAPGLAWLGAMLPYTPIHHLLFDAAAAPLAELSDAAPLALVMTSANPGGEPLVIDNDEAFARLAGIADAFLVHDRAIVARCDDSVVRVARCDDSVVRVAGCDDSVTGDAAGTPQFIRRARGYTPQAIRLPAAGPAVLAFGGGFKNTVCATRGDEAFVSTHVGDLDNAAACAFLDETVERLLAIGEFAPAAVAADRHPDLYASRAAAAFAAARGLPLIEVQHHHAHVAAVCAEHGLAGPVLGLALDGIGFGDDSDGSGNAWGGELLRVDGAQCERLGHLAPLPLPGGDRAAREPWRMAAAALWRLGRGEEIARRFAAEPAAPTVATMLARRLHAPPTTSTGRLFDAAAGLLGVAARQSFEGQAAMRLEALAAAHGAVAPLSGGWTLDAGGPDFAPLLAALVDERDAARGAAIFHATLAAGLVAWVAAAAAASGLERVCAGGGCLLNAVLAGDLRRGLAARGLRLFEARAVPPGDGGLSLGQAWVAMQAVEER